MISRITPLQKELKNLIIDQTPKTPQIDLNQLTGELIFSGKSIPENSARIYAPAYKWVEKYIRKARPVTNLRLHLEYFNAATTLWLANIIKLLVRIKEPEYVLFIHLYLPTDEFVEMKDFDDINEVFFPLADIIQGAIPSVGIKLNGSGDTGEEIENTLIFIESEQLTSLKYA